MGRVFYQRSYHIYFLCKQKTLDFLFHSSIPITSITPSSSYFHHILKLCLGQLTAYNTDMSKDRQLVVHLIVAAASAQLAEEKQGLATGGARDWRRRS